MGDSQKDITSWSSKNKDGGQFKRQVSSFRDTIDKNGKFPPEAGRYHLVVSLACPWAHRALIVRKLKGLDKLIDVSTVHPHMGGQGWSFSGEGYEGQGKPANDFNYTKPSEAPYGFEKLRQLYFKADKNYDARFTVPVLWDKKTETIVNNESSEIIRMFNHAFDDLIDEKHKGVSYYPDNLKKEIDDLNEWVYDTVNNGVYKCGFASTQEAYESNYHPLHKSLRRLDDLLKGKDYLIGDTLTEADVRLYTTIVRYDPVYTGHFKCTGTIRHDYPELNRWLKNLYWNEPAFKDTTDFDHIKVHYYSSHPQINPTRIVPAGPEEPIEKL
ncbi:hypothetical protein P389DRAFT_182787 [Cystobasidium minutum MCA 4210]|uniref:uncharacterized protein n=1 Tax=Cystobasidium minutum MCA 4210 TaxID=1397322 RepID=UPI0034CDCF2D|eukprot:jgi/Rhomi1/182787/fgenesh1_pm.2_\